MFLFRMKTKSNPTVSLQLELVGLGLGWGLTKTNITENPDYKKGVVPEKEPENEAGRKGEEEKEGNPSQLELDSLAPLNCSKDWIISAAGTQDTRAESPHCGETIHHINFGKIT